MPSVVLVSGVTGYLGAHVARECLEQGYVVRGTVRSLQKGEYLKTLFSKHADRFEIVKVPDIAVDHAFDEAVKGVDFVIHTASPFHYNVTSVYKDLIDPAVKGTTGILKSVASFAPNVKRVVITSSMAAVRSATPKNPAGLSEEDWNDFAVGELERLGEGLGPVVGYPALLGISFGAEKRSFDLVVCNPPFIYGPPIHEVAKYEDLNTSVKIIADYLTGAIAVRNLTLGYVDVRDVATAHVRALTSEKASGKRIIVSAGTCTHYEVVDILKRRFPDRPVAKYSEEEEVLGMEYLGLEKIIVETAEEVIKRFL
ncbi:hypothetical protein BC829DRAFT_440377 [Chytridium lagenaria]|nr:hypothetical protein BC829DRAFT_440377 [Chytridium lagenaria]